VLSHKLCDLCEIMLSHQIIVPALVQRWMSSSNYN